MFFLIVGIALLVGSVCIAMVLKKKVVLLAIPAAFVLIVASCFTSVPTGYTGIVTTFGRVENMTFEAGFHMKAPWQEVVTMDNREQRVKFNFEAFSSDIQQVKVSGSINFSIDKATAMTLYRNVGTSYADTLISPRLYENTKSVFSRYTAESLVEQRTLLSSEVLSMMKNDMSSYGLNIISVAIENIDFTDAFTDAVEAKQVATQTYQRALTEEQQKTMEAEQAAQREKIAAQAKADVAKIQADAEAYAITAKAEAQAKANAQIAASLTQTLIDYVQAQNWDGVLPTTFVGTGDALPVLNIPAATNGDTQSVQNSPAAMTFSFE